MCKFTSIILHYQRNRQQFFIFLLFVDYQKDRMCRLNEYKILFKKQRIDSKTEFSYIFYFSGMKLYQLPIKMTAYPFQLKQSGCKKHSPEIVLIV